MAGVGFQQHMLFWLMQSMVMSSDDKQELTSHHPTGQRMLQLDIWFTDLEIYEINQHHSQPYDIIFTNGSLTRGYHSVCNFVTYLSGKPTEERADAYLQLEDGNQSCHCFTHLTD